MEQISKDARMAAIGGTRQLIHEDEFRVLVALLVDCGAVPRAVMSATLAGLADQMIAKARGEMESNFQVYPAELFDRARSLGEAAAALRTDSGAKYQASARQ